MQKRGNEIQNMNLFRISQRLDLLTQQVDKRIEEEKNRYLRNLQVHLASTSGSSLSQQQALHQAGSAVFLNSSQHVDPQVRDRVHTLLYRGVESARCDQLYKDMLKRPFFLIQRKQKMANVLKNYMD